MVSKNCYGENPRTGAESEKANLILITFDQWRGDWANQRRPKVRLDAIKKIAREGWTAKHCYTSSPQCVPARLSWITGLRPSQLNVTRNKPVNLPGNARSMIRDLRDDGWHTAIVGKTHWTSHSKKVDLRDNKSDLYNLGFNQSIEIAGPRALRIIECDLTEEWKKSGVYEKHIEDLKNRYKNGVDWPAWKVEKTKLPLELYPDIWIANKGITLLKEMPENSPWILWISFVGPHEPFDTPKPWSGIHKNHQLPKTIKNN